MIAPSQKTHLSRSLSLYTIVINQVLSIKLQEQMTFTVYVFQGFAYSPAESRTSKDEELPLSVEMNLL
jgi:hypothetical protein